MTGHEWRTGGPGAITIAGVRLEAACWGPPPGEAPTVVMLHEGLGSVGLWRDFPEKIAAATGWGVFAWSRAGYGRSDPAPLPRPVDYMTREATEVLPHVLDAIGFRRGVLLGHSDGATIAAEYAGGVEDLRVRGLILIAPHFFTEPAGLAAIAEAKAAYDGGDLRGRLAKHHEHVDVAFNGWADAWLNPAFHDWNVAECIDYLRVPTLAIQGREDRYGTLAQIEELETRSYAPVDRLVLDGCGHSPHREKPEETLGAVAEFVARLARIEAIRAGAPAA